MMTVRGCKILIVVAFLSTICNLHSFAKEKEDYANFETGHDLTDFGRLLVDLVVKMKPGHCYAFITDGIYESVLTDVLFLEIQRQPRYLVRIPDDEDTLDPGPRVRCMLEEIRKIGCGAYVILIANGIQVERLLRFGDRTRIINTRAKFIILHDYRLFVPELHFLWKRVVNVVFIRELVIDKVRGIAVNDGRHYELSTVPFPFPLRGIFISKKLDFWHNGKFRKSRRLFMDKTSNLDGQTMRVVVLAHTPVIFRTTYNETDTHLKYYGLEVELLKAVSEALKFKMEFYETEDAATAMWGTVTDEDNATGLLGQMYEGRADFALADLHHTQYHLQIMDLSIPYNTECLTFLTPEALTDNSWTTLILPFTGGMWAGILTSLFSIGSVFYALSRMLMYVRHDKSYQHDLDMIAKKPRKNKKKKVQIKGIANVFKQKLKIQTKCRKHKKKSDELDLSKLKKLRMVPFKRQALPWKDPLPSRDIFDTFAGCIIYTYSMLLLVSLPRLPRGWPLRLLTGWYWVYCILLVVAYRASLTAILANPVARVTIDKLKDLADSPIRCGAWGEQNIQFFKTAQDQASMVIGNKLEHTPNAHAAVKRVVDGNFAYYDNMYMLKHLRATQSSEKARETLHIMEECAVHMPISIGMEKNSPLKPKVDRYVRALVETGLTNKWLADAIEVFQSNVELPPQEATIDLKKLTAAFIALAIGYGLALLAFGTEKLYWRCVVEKHPAYDKYIVGSYRGKVVKI